MFAALIKAAIFYFIFIQIRKFLRNSGVLSDSKSEAQKYRHQDHASYHTHKTQHGPKSSNDKDVIEADYRIID